MNARHPLAKCKFRDEIEYKLLQSPNIQSNVKFLISYSSGIRRYPGGGDGDCRFVAELILPKDDCDADGHIGEKLVTASRILSSG
uniref:Uncharacterized protein n=1 Tax=Glossina palpalis gambiensis TaxID=67801 RepID=A0A1B0C3R1_9MUSC